MKSRRLYGLWPALALALTTLLAGTAQAAPAAREVLPDTVTPVHYDLSLSPDIEGLTFKGRVAITIEVKSPVQDIALNAEGLDFDHVALDGGGAITATADAKVGREMLHLDRPVATGRHVLTIDYHGKIGRSTFGFFAMDYAGPDGPRRTLATNFEPAGARQLLPCWDEPGRKATFTVTVDAPKDRLAVSNMPVAQTTPLSASMQRVRFAESPKMSTYLLFLGVGDFERIHRVVDGVDVGVVVKRGDTAKAQYALDQAVRVLHYYNDYFGVPFPLPKLDLIAAPGQITGGAMENWGAIFYSQRTLLFDPKASTEADRQLVFLVVSHEMAHQWFGDLVTMAWWDDLWLNEGFARWMQTYAADDLHPEWKTGLRALSIFEDGKQADAVPSTHPVVQQVLTADQASQAFDSITYDKGAAIITMINAYVGRDAFREGVRRYMHAHAFSNTVDSDLWSIMQETAGQPILDIEHDLTSQPGVPLLRVAAKGPALTLSEGRYADDPDTIAGVAPQSWRLPVSVQALPDGQPQSVLLGAQPVEVALAPPVLVNAGQKTYGRVLYAGADFTALAGRIGALSSADQFGLLNDTFALGLSGYRPASDALVLIGNLPVEADPIVWQRAIGMLREIDGHYPAGPAKTAFRKTALALLRPLADRTGLASRPQEDANLQILRGSLISLRGVFGDPAVIAWAGRTLAAGETDPGVRRAALGVAAATADAAGFDAVLARAKTEKDPLEKQNLFEALANVQDPALARRMIEIAFGDDAPAGVGPYLVMTVANNHPDLAWDLALPHLEDPKAPMEKDLRWRITASIAGISARSERIAAVEAYEARAVPEEARRPFVGALGSIRQNQKIAARALPEIDRWVADRGGR